VLAYTGGGPTDFLARLVSDSVSKRLGQPVLIEPKPGANERVATAHLIASPADGYTAVLVAPPHATNPSLFQLAYDTPRETTGLIHLVNIAPVLTTYPDSGLNNFNDLVKLARAKPGEVTFGSAGNATSTHLTVELLGLLAGVQLQHVPYKGDAPAITELLGKRIHASSNTITAGLPHIKAGRLKALGISSRERSPLLPEVPTFIEQGYPEAEITTWFGLIVHAATPKEIVDKLNAEFNHSLQLPEVRERLAQVGMTPVGGSPEQFTAHIRRETERWAKVIQTRGIKVE
jgi:tripartite-type tricarboxylate transporter receptor subunit TctC